MRGVVEPLESKGFGGTAAGIELTVRCQAVEL
jgi:hypothetical protein